MITPLSSWNNDTLVQLLSPIGTTHYSWMERIGEWYLLNYVMTFCSLLFHCLFVRPLAIFYLYGPRYGNWGMWGGVSPSDICAQLTHVDATHWIEHPQICNELIRKRFYSFLLLVYAILYAGIILWLLYFVTRVCTWMLWRCIWGRPPSLLFPSSLSTTSLVTPFSSCVMGGHGGLLYDTDFAASATCHHYRHTGMANHSADTIHKNASNPIATMSLHMDKISGTVQAPTTLENISDNPTIIFNNNHVDHDARAGTLLTS